MQESGMLLKGAANNFSRDDKQGPTSLILPFGYFAFGSFVAPPPMTDIMGNNVRRQLDESLKIRRWWRKIRQL
jgi:hypothetical protein